MDSVIPFPNRKFVQEEAAHWVIRIEQQALSDSETIELKSWLQASSVHAQIFRETLEVYGRADILTVLAELLPLEQVKQPPPRPSLYRQYSLPIAACVMLLVTTLSVFMWQGGWNPMDQGGWDPMDNVQRELASYSTAIGDSKVVVLSDESTVTMNTDTLINIQFDEQHRRLVLDRGEAYFKVAKNPDRPFIVYAGDGQITAVGTAFSVYKRQNVVEVTVTEGKVTVQSDRAILDTLPAPSMDDELSGSGTPITAVLLQSGQVVSYDDEKIIAQVETVETNVIVKNLIWQQGMLAFEAEPLENVIAEFSRYNQQEIIIVDDELKALKVDGYFRSGDISGMLDSLQFNFGVKITRLDNDSISLSLHNGAHEGLAPNGAYEGFAPNGVYEGFAPK